jgi:dCTP deaminase
MILTGGAIQTAVKRGEITIDPFCEDQINPNSYNFRLGRNLISVEEGKKTEKVLDDDGMLFFPKLLYLGVTAEVIGSSTYVPTLIGRSSIGRLGIFVQISADLGNLGPAHQWTLEIVVSQPVRLYPMMTFGQVSFWRPLGGMQPYLGTFGWISQPFQTPSDFEF